jgi:hypothetical protein
MTARLASERRNWHCEADPVMAFSTGLLHDPHGGRASVESAVLSRALCDVYLPARVRRNHAREVTH